MFKFRDGATPHVSRGEAFFIGKKYFEYESPAPIPVSLGSFRIADLKTLDERALSVNNWRMSIGFRISGFQ
jgi:hypothetical protein